TIHVLVLFALLAIFSLTGCKKNDDNIVIEVESYGSPADATRVSNLQQAAEELNKILEEKGDPRRIEIKANHYSSGYDEYNQRFILAHKSNKAADIRTISHADIA